MKKITLLLLVISTFSFKTQRSNSLTIINDNHKLKTCFGQEQNKTILNLINETYKKNKFKDIAILPSNINPNNNTTEVSITILFSSGASISDISMLIGPMDPIDYWLCDNGYYNVVCRNIDIRIPDGRKKGDKSDEDPEPSVTNGISLADYLGNSQIVEQFTIGNTCDSNGSGNNIIDN